MIKTNILFAISALGLAFLLLIFTALRTSGNSNFDSSYTFSLATGRQKDCYEKNFAKENEEIKFVYPGILPNHPLYWIKMIRDRGQYYLTRNPIKRLGLLMLYSDKRLVSGIILISEGETDLGISTITKAEKYLAKAAIFAKENMPEDENKELYWELVNKYFNHRQEIEKLLISDLAEDKKQVLYSLLEGNNVLFKDKYSDYVNEISNNCGTCESDKCEN